MTSTALRPPSSVKLSFVPQLITSCLYYHTASTNGDAMTDVTAYSMIEHELPPGHSVSHWNLAD